MCPAVTKILDLPENQEVAVVGTLYKEMKLKPSILNEYNKVEPLLMAHRHSSSCLKILWSPRQHFHVVIFEYAIPWSSKAIDLYVGHPVTSSHQYAAHAISAYAASHLTSKWICGVQAPIRNYVHRRKEE